MGLSTLKTVALILILLNPAQHALCFDPIRVLGLGSVDSVQSPIPRWLSDPVFELSLVPTRLYDTEAITPDEARRILRLYFPRNDADIQGYDCMVFSGGDVRYFEPLNIQMMVRAVEAGTAAATDMGGMSRPLHETYIASGLWEVFPNDVNVINSLWDQGVPADQDFSIVVNRELDHNPLYPFIPLGIEELVGGRTRVISPRPGSTVYAWTESESFLGTKFSFRPAAAVGWSFERGRTIALEGWFGHSWWSNIIDLSNAEYGQDILINYILEITGGQYLEEIVQVHALRQSFSDFRERLAFVTQLMVFVENFGANAAPLYGELEEVQGEFSESYVHYIEGRTGRALEVTQRSNERLEEIRMDALKLKDRALLWIYIIEWLSVFGTLMMAGYALDQLMIRRKLYRMSTTTRLAGR